MTRAAEPWVKSTKSRSASRRGSNPTAVPPSSEATPSPRKTWCRKPNWIPATQTRRRPKATPATRDAPWTTGTTGPPSSCGQKRMPPPSAASTDLHHTAEQFLAACKKSRKPSKKLLELGAALIAEAHRCSQTNHRYGLPLDPVLQGICYISSGQLLEQGLATFGQTLLAQLDASTWVRLVARFDPALFEPHISKIAQERISENAAAIIDPLDALLSNKPDHPLTKIAANKLRFVNIERLPSHYGYRRRTETPKAIHTFLASSHLAGSTATLKHFREQITQDRSLDHLRGPLQPPCSSKPTAANSASPDRSSQRFSPRQSASSQRKPNANSLLAMTGAARWQNPSKRIPAAPISTIYSSSCAPTIEKFSKSRLGQIYAIRSAI